MRSWMVIAALALGCSGSSEGDEARDEGAAEEPNAGDLAVAALPPSATPEERAAAWTARRSASGCARSMSGRRSSSCTRARR